MSIREIIQPNNYDLYSRNLNVSGDITNYDVIKESLNENYFIDTYTAVSGTTNIAVQNTFYKLNVITILSDFNGPLTMPVSNRITYTGDFPVYFDFEVYLTLKSTANNVGFSVQMFKNGNIPIPKSLFTDTFVSSADTEFVSSTAILQMNKNDYVEIFVNNTSGVQNIQCFHYDFSAISLKTFNS